MSSINKGMLLQSTEHGQLLDIIDQFRFQGIERHIPLPQIIVTGDQTSGKSSVLEAISSVRFPSNEGVCTRFATEVSLRRADEESSTVTIVPGTTSSLSRSSEELERIKNFSSSATPEGIAAVIDDAKLAMGLTPESKTITDDVLKVEICGPHQPHLTLVDLPGVYHAGQGAEAVKEKVLEYMRSQRSIILAIVSARSDRELQIITELVKKVDPKGDRTFGIITKPDEIKSGMEHDWLNLAQNRVVTYHHGWHVLRNRDHKDRHQSAEDRDSIEAMFFSQFPWRNLPPAILGIHTLRPRLSSVLKDHIMRELPSLCEDVERGILECQSTLSKLGQPRNTFKEQQSHLFKVSREFTALSRAAVDGNYGYTFFGTAFAADSVAKRLRANVQRLLQDFKDEMYRRGHQFDIVKVASGRPQQGDHPCEISEANFYAKVKHLIKTSRGRELSQCYNPLIISELFFEQAQPWKDIADKYCKLLFKASRTCVGLILDEVTDNSTKNGLVDTVVSRRMTSLDTELRQKVAEILRPHQQGHVITYADYTVNDAKTEMFSYISDRYDKAIHTFFGCESGSGDYITESFQLKDLMGKLKLQKKEVLRDFACIEIVEHMKAYYQIAIKRFIDSFASQGFENTVMVALPELISPEVVMELDEDQINHIAGETASNKALREYSTSKCASLELGKTALASLRRGDSFNLLEGDDIFSCSTGEYVFGNLSTPASISDKAPEREDLIGVKTDMKKPEEEPVPEVECEREDLIGVETNVRKLEEEPVLEVEWYSSSVGKKGKKKSWY